MPETARKDREYCDVNCRRAAWRERADAGRVVSVRLLKSGRLSVVIHVEDTSLKPGDTIKVGKWTLPL